MCSCQNLLLHVRISYIILILSIFDSLHVLAKQELRSLLVSIRSVLLKMFDDEFAFALITQLYYLFLKLRRILLEPIETGEDIIQVAGNIMNNSINGEVQDTVTPMDADFTDGNFSFLLLCIHVFKY